MRLSARWACQTFWTWVSTEAIVLDYEDGKTINKNDGARAVVGSERRGSDTYSDASAP